jgi:hypothetical protein
MTDKLKFLLTDVQNILQKNLQIRQDFDDLNKSIKIVEQRNVNQYSKIEKEIENFTRILFETGVLYNLDEETYKRFMNNLNQINNILNNHTY